MRSVAAKSSVCAGLTPPPFPRVCAGIKGTGKAGSGKMQVAGAPHSGECIGHRVSLVPFEGCGPVELEQFPLDMWNPLRSAIAEPGRLVCTKASRQGQPGYLLVVTYHGRSVDREGSRWGIE